MKKILLASVAFFLFSISMSLLQTSCDKDADASPEGNTEVKAANKLVYIKAQQPEPWTGLPEHLWEIWTSNLDGTGQTKINVNLPSGYYIGYNDGGPIVSLDGKKLIFLATNTTGYHDYIFYCNLDGSNVTKMIDGSDTDQICLGGVY